VWLPKELQLRNGEELSAGVIGLSPLKFLICSVWAEAGEPSAFDNFICPYMKNVIVVQ
jgi:hypothetical protein